MIMRNEPKLHLGRREHRYASTIRSLQTPLPAKSPHEKRALFKVVRKFFLIQQHIRIPIFPVEPILDLPDAPNGP